MTSAVENCRKWRKRSQERIELLALPVNEHLPLLEDAALYKTERACIRRALALYCFLHFFFGEASKYELAEWLDYYNLKGEITPKEQLFLKWRKNTNEIHGVESLYALCWALSTVNTLDEREYVPDSLASDFPNIYLHQAPDQFERKSLIRDFEELANELDFLYCYHWALVHCRINGITNSNALDETTIRDRRAALEWILSNDEWDAVNLDT